MRPFRLRSDLERARVGGFALPLGLVPRDLPPPISGYELEYVPSEEEEDPDTYAFRVAISHERVAEALDALFELLPEEVFPILEVGSRDAYRSVDVLLGREAMRRDDFLRTWRAYEPFLLEDASVGAGANGDEPVVEVFLDHWKGINVHAPITMRERVEQILHGLGLREVPETWPEIDDEAAARLAEVRSVLRIRDEFDPDEEELLLDLRATWDLELDEDPEENLDEGGRLLGHVLWSAMLILEDAADELRGTYATIWATASSRAEMQELVETWLDEHPEWEFLDVYAMDRVAYDERPEELVDLPPRREQAAIHHVTHEVWLGRGDAPGPPLPPPEPGVS